MTKKDIRPGILQTTRGLIEWASVVAPAFAASPVILVVDQSAGRTGRTHNGR